MGTDHLGRDMLSRVVWGARLSLYVGLTSVLFGITVGALWGVVTAYFGGITDTASHGARPHPRSRASATCAGSTTAR